MNQITGTGEDTLANRMYIRTLPNPVSNKLNIYYGITKKGIYKIEIYDRTGRSVFSLPEEEKAAWEI